MFRSAVLTDFRRSGSKMTVRPLKASDIPLIEESYRKLGFSYEMPDLNGSAIEYASVVVDSEDQPVMAFAAERILQSYLFPIREMYPAAKLSAVRMLHEAGAIDLRAKGYHELNAFLPPEVEKSFGKRLSRTFGWARNWVSYYIKF